MKCMTCSHTSHSSSTSSGTNAGLDRLEEESVETEICFDVSRCREMCCSIDVSMGINKTYSK